MSAYRLRQEARIDLNEIFAYIAERNPSAAERVITQFFDYFDLIASERGIGRSWLLGNEKLRVCNGPKSTSSYRIYYLMEDDGSIEIYRVVHGHRDQRKALGDADE